MTELQSYEGYYLWNYVPSRVAAVIYILLSLGATAYHIAKIWKLKTYFCTCFTIGGITYDRTGQIMPFSIQSVFILLGPALFAASVYMVLGRVIVAVHSERHSPIRVRWLTKL
ncbi:hypothetical protein BJX66DRAFT_345398 [Aspergillus keveii]|uniref:RTA1 domain protein n=1 Tax=Aspergillus keveii TaxID=714993 RepID=A0ABR4FI85_9EURO